MRIHWESYEGASHCNLAIGLFKLESETKHTDYSVSRVFTLYLLASAGWVEMMTISRGISDDEEANEKGEAAIVLKLQEYAVFLSELEQQ